MKFIRKIYILVLAVFFGLGMSTWLQAKPLTSWLAVVNKKDQTVSIVDLNNSDNSWVATVGYQPHEVVSAHHGKSVFVANYGNQHVRSRSLENIPGNTVSVINTATRLVKTLDLGGSHPCSPHGMAASGDGDRIYVTCEARQEVVVIDAVSEQVSHAISTNQAGSHMVVVASDEKRAYVANFWHGTVTALDLQNRKILAQIPTGNGTEGIGLSPDGKFLYVTSVITNQLMKIDTATLEIVGRNYVGENTSPIRVLVTPDGQNLVVNVAGRGEVHTFDPVSLELKAQIKVGSQNIGLAVGGSGYAYSANMLDGTVSVVNLRSGLEERKIPVGGLPDGVSFFSGE